MDVHAQITAGPAKRAPNTNGTVGAISAPSSSPEGKEVAAVASDGEEPDVWPLFD